MRPYLAVIADSFRAAFSSRVLWVAIAAIYLFLFSLAPIGYREVYTTSIRWFDFSNATRMKAMLAEGIAKETPTPSGMIAKALPEELRTNLKKVAEGEEVRIRLDLLADALSGLLDSDDWYDASVWGNTNRLRELRELEERSQDELNEELRRRRARLRIESALPGVFENRNARSIALTYAGFDFPAVFQIDPTQFKLVLNHFVLRIIIDWVLGFVMIFLGILVTAAIIPDMLQPGSLHLLLSKPISRPWLFIAKFIGGCAFVLLCVAQLIIGLWLISGWRLGIWNARLLLCIPVCVFLFAVFYSVSALAGLKWRSPILSIGLANAFGAFCLVTGIVGGVSDGFITGPDRIESLVVAGDNLFASTQGADLRRFDTATQKWIDLFPDDSGGGDRVLAPVLLADGRVATARVRGGRMNLFGSGATSLLVLDPVNDWKPLPTIELPTATSQLWSTSQGEVIAINSTELMIADSDAIRSEEDQRGEKGKPESTPGKNDATASTGESAGESAGVGKERIKIESTRGVNSNWLPKLMRMMGGATEGFRSLTPGQVSVVPPRSVAFGEDENSAFVASSGKLVRLDRPQSDRKDEAWQLAKSVDLEMNAKAMWVRTMGDEVVVIRAEMPPTVFDQSLEPTNVEGFAEKEFAALKITEVVSCPGVDAVAMLTAKGDVYLLRRKLLSKISLRQIPKLSGVDAIHWDQATRRLWASHSVDSVTSFDLEAMAIDKQFRPKLEGWRLVDRYLVTPIRTVTPQTGELGETIAAIVSGESTMELPISSEAPQTERYNVWRPVLTCAGFIFVMLTIGCVYFARADF